MMYECASFTVHHKLCIVLCANAVIYALIITYSCIYFCLAFCFAQFLLVSISLFSIYTSRHQTLLWVYYNSVNNVSHHALCSFRSLLCDCCSCSNHTLFFRSLLFYIQTSFLQCLTTPTRLSLKHGSNSNMLKMFQRCRLFNFFLAYSSDFISFLKNIKTQFEVLSNLIYLVFKIDVKLKMFAYNN